MSSASAKSDAQATGGSITGGGFSWSTMAIMAVAALAAWYFFKRKS